MRLKRIFTKTAVSQKLFNIVKKFSAIVLLACFHLTNILLICIKIVRT